MDILDYFRFEDGKMHIFIYQLEALLKDVSHKIIENLINYRSTQKILHQDFSKNYKNV